jgi:hypothetical protein
LARPSASRRYAKIRDLTGVEPHADLDVDAVGAAYLLRVVLDRLLHPQRRITGADSVVFVGEGSAEERHDAVAHHLVHRALIVMDGLHHAIQHRIEDSSRLLRVTVGEQLHRPLHVGEQDRDLFALAFEGTPRLQDLLGEVLGSVRLGRDKTRSAGNRDGQTGRVCTLGTEPGRCG